MALPRGAAPQVQPARATSERAAASISGRVFIADRNASSSPVRRARVTLEPEGGSSPRTTDTDTNGRFQFADVSPGRYRIKAEKPGFVTFEVGQLRPFARPELVTVAPGQATTAELYLPRGAAIEGRVLDASGAPLEDLTVSALRLTYDLQGRQPIVVAQVRTDDLGRYRLHSLPAGEYQVSASLSASGSVLQNGCVVEPGGATSGGYADTYYPGTATVGDAHRIQLGAGQQAGGFDFPISCVAMGRLQVRVATSSGASPTSVAVRLRPIAQSPARISGISSPRTPGTVIYGSVPPGSYWLLAVVQADPTGPAEFAAQRVAANGGDQGEIAVRTAPGMRIGGRIVTAAGDALPALAESAITFVETDYQLPVLSGVDVQRPVRIDAAGQFSVPSLFGPRIARISNLPSGWALESVWLDDTDITDVVSNFTSAETPRNLRLVLTRHTATVSGAVRGAEQRTAPSARVIVFPASEAQWTPWSRFVQMAVVDVRGQFSLTGLLPGRYFVCAVDDLEDDAWKEPDVLRRLKEQADVVELIDGAKPSVNLVLRRLP